MEQMKKFIGTKEVSAMPMTLGEFIKMSGRNPYENDGKIHGGNEPGYLVKYEDGYKSWSPKEVFEKAYRCSDTFFDRLLIELSDLNEKLIKLGKFFETTTYANLPHRKMQLLQTQFHAMNAYSMALCMRIEAEERDERPVYNPDHGCTCAPISSEIPDCGVNHDDNGCTCDGCDYTAAE